MKTLKNLIWMAALALTATTWTACSNVDEPTTIEQPAQARTYTLTTTLSPRDGVTRSKMEYVDETTGITAEWEKNDQIWVRYDNYSAAGTAETTATVTAVDPTTKAATITVKLTDPSDGGDIIFGYPLSHYNGTKDPDTHQIGTLDDINANFAAISGNGSLTVSGSDVTLPAAVTMEPEMCIWKFSFTDGSDDITSAITRLIIDFPANGMTYTVSPTSLSNIYVALYGDVINAQPINIYAKTATGVYRKSAASVTLATGTTYTSTGLVLTSAATANAVTGDVGKVIGADGNIYPNADIATACGTTALAKIAYVGNDAETSTSNTTYKHGLALALTDASTTAWCNQYSANCMGSQYNNETAAKGDMAGIANTDYLINNAPDGHTHSAASAARGYNGGTHPTGTSAWFLPSAGQWYKMSTNAGLLGTYWSSTEVSGAFAWAYNFNLDSWMDAYKDTNIKVRSALAF